MIQLLPLPFGPPPAAKEDSGISGCDRAVGNASKVRDVWDFPMGGLGDPG